MDTCKCNTNPEKKSSSVYLRNKAAAYVFGKSKKKQLRSVNNNASRKHKKINAFECDANGVQTPFLKYAELAQRLGAWQVVNTCSPFCTCRSCCGCENQEYLPELDRAAKRIREVRAFDARVRTQQNAMKIMYDI